MMLDFPRTGDTSRTESKRQKGVWPGGKQEAATLGEIETVLGSHTGNGWGQSLEGLE